MQDVYLLVITQYDLLCSHVRRPFPLHAMEHAPHRGDLVAIYLDERGYRDLPDCVHRPGFVGYAYVEKRSQGRVYLTPWRLFPSIRVDTLTDQVLHVLGELKRSDLQLLNDGLRDVVDKALLHFRRQEACLRL